MFGMGHRIGEVRPCAVSPAWIRTDKRTSCDFAGRSIMGLELWSKFEWSGQKLELHQCAIVACRAALAKVAKQVKHCRQFRTACC